MRLIYAALTLTTILLAAFHAQSADYTYISIDDPSANVPGASLGSTAAFGINNRGQIVGLYVDFTGPNHGFLDTGGLFTTLDAPGALNTGASGINNNGQIVGFYHGNPQVDNTGDHGFLYSGGTFTTINVPGAENTEIKGINASGQVVGVYTDAMGQHGFLDSHGVFTTLNVPGASATQAWSINSRGQIVGYCLPSTGSPQRPPTPMH
jgi:uncharacterized membrane protein